MTRLSVWQIPATAMLLFVVCLPGAAWAATGTAVSAPAAIDTRLPVIVVESLPTNAVYQAGETITLAWTVTEDNPGTDTADNQAEIWFGDVFHEAISFSPGLGPHTWQWTVADTTSGTTHLVVRSTDTFGNTTTERNEDFTILSATTDVPRPGNPLVFAPPSPNPFNPLTRLRFDLPDAGPVQLTVHDARGYRINTLQQGYQPAGALTLQWDGTDTGGRRQAGGTYFLRLVYRASGQTAQVVRKVVLLP